MALLQSQEELKAISGHLFSTNAPPQASISVQVSDSITPVSTVGMHRIREDDARRQQQFSMYMNKKRFAQPEWGLQPLGERPVTQHRPPGLSADAGNVSLIVSPQRVEGLRSALMLKAQYAMMCSIVR